MAADGGDRMTRHRTLTCAACGEAWKRERQRGRLPKKCPPCREGLQPSPRAHQEPTRTRWTSPAESWPTPDLTEPHSTNLHPDVIRAAAVTGPLALTRAAASRSRMFSLRSSWEPWASFCRYHDLDPHRPTDETLVAFVEARAWAGISYGAIRTMLITVELAITGEAVPSRLTVAARRWLTLLHDEGILDPSQWQAPVLTVGEVLGLVRAAETRPRLDRSIRKDALTDLLVARDRLLVLWAYLFALRPTEWTWIDLEHVRVHDDHVQVLLPSTKTGTWQTVAVHRDEHFDPVELLVAYLDLRGREPGPLLVDGWGEVGYRVSASTIGYALRAAAAHTGLRSFTPYSLRRSRATHLFLAGTSQKTIRRVLRHRSLSTYRRYVESHWAVMDLEHAKVMWLSTDVPDRDPVPLIDVCGKPRETTKRGAFKGGPLHELLDGIDVASLVVVEDLAERTQQGLNEGAASYEEFAAWCEVHGCVPADEDSLSLWLATTYAHAACAPSTVQTAAARIATGWSLIHHASRSSWPAWVEAADVIEGLVRMKGESHESQARSRPAAPDDLAAICRTVPDRPVAWAANVLRTIFGAGHEMGLHDLGPDTVTISRSGQARTVGRSPDGLMMCPVAAAEVLAAVGVVEVAADQGEVGWEAVYAAAMPYTVALRDEVTVGLLAASGGRASDVSRAPLVGVEHVPGGTVCWLTARKGHRREVEQEYLWVPSDGVDGVDVQAALMEWMAWCPWSSGPLVPVLEPAAMASGNLVAQQATAVTSLLQTRIDAGVEAGQIEAGLTPYGWRYRFAADALDRGVPLGGVADAMGHTNEATTLGYARRVDPFIGSDVLKIYEGFAREAEEQP